jgi:hypothetical protein
MAWSIEKMLLEPFGLEYRKDALGAIWLGVSKGCSWSLMAWSVEWKFLFGEIYIYQFRY